MFLITSVVLFFELLFWFKFIRLSFYFWCLSYDSLMGYIFFLHMIFWYSEYSVFAKLIDMLGVRMLVMVSCVEWSVWFKLTVW